MRLMTTIMSMMMTMDPVYTTCKPHCTRNTECLRPPPRRISGPRASKVCLYVWAMTAGRRMHLYLAVCGARMVEMPAVLTSIFHIVSTGAEHQRNTRDL